jgi:hypothetical protein
LFERLCSCRQGIAHLNLMQLSGTSFGARKTRRAGLTEKPSCRLCQCAI